MDYLEVHDEIGGIQVDVKLQSGLNIICQNSGCGKSYLFRLLLPYCMTHQIPCRLVDYRNVSNKDADEMIPLLCKGKQLVLMDNADLYLTSELVDKIISDVPFILISSKLAYMDFLGKVTGRYFVNYTDSKLELLRNERL